MLQLILMHDGCKIEFSNETNMNSVECSEIELLLYSKKLRNTGNCIFGPRFKNTWQCFLFMM